ncbi:arylamine N-acetyltransferase family protein [Mesobacillus maritimus]|uniref:Arylamine N-acetyltransferase n=1 Tax=Mesobacillus maritimus TaxID=1643336 RepID=A0ABS7K845_9BACI|nr:arylamine N-acetyltransferase [Mesobacillus maritimus]MBY0098433.1 arylamine N-acetyltransferase [Mesobacillus maritimus]
MNDLNLQFRSRIGFPPNIEISFENLDFVLEKTAKAIPFENLCILGNRISTISKETLMNKIIHQKEGGLCYELNTIFHLFLLENGFKTSLIRGMTYDHNGHQWNPIGKTHVTIIMNDHEQPYIVDTGFGGNLPLKPVPLSGGIVVSNNGEFRIECVDRESGDYIFYMKLRHKHKDWKIGYTFNVKDDIQNVSDLNAIQTIIVEHPKSPFNKNPLLTMLTDDGNMILTENSFTEWVNGKVEKKEIDQNQFNELAKEHFGIQEYKEQDE